MAHLLGIGETLVGYDRWAASYDHEPNPLIAATSWVLQSAPLGCADCDVVELGCGTGRNVVRVIGEGARSYTGVDGSGGMLTIATHRFYDPRVTFQKADLLLPWTAPRQYDFGLVCLVLEHLSTLDVLAETLARAVKPGGRIRLVDLHPERVAAGSFAHFHDGQTEVQFASVAHPVASICEALEGAGFDVVRRDWLASDPMISAVPGIQKHRGLKAVLDIKATRRGRMARGSSGY
ncbi:MAG: class I SAM-dependent methyltransferase [Deltaproteobacteria bacterium]|nr:class I SAM-dependent methyltransferase [Deltaproteobacteria bacterium]